MSFQMKKRMTMMKIFKQSTLFLSVILLSACGGESSKEAKTGEEREAAEAGDKSRTYKVDTDKSQLEWVGRKQSGKHEGTVDMKAGNLKAKDGELKAGRFVADMESIEVTDEDIDDESYEKLMGHLRSPDFFSVDSFPEASFELTGIEESDGDTAMDNATHHIAGNLTIKGITKNVSEIPAKIKVKKDKVTAEAEFAFDRTRWDIMFKSKSILDDLKDGFIYDLVDLRIELVAKKADVKVEDVKVDKGKKEEKKDDKDDEKKEEEKES